MCVGGALSEAHLSRGCIEEIINCEALVVNGMGRIFLDRE